MCLAGFQLRCVIGGNEVYEIKGLGTADLDFTHMTDIKEPHGAPDGMVLINDARVLHGHIPASKVDHLSAVGPMHRVEGRGFENAGGLSHGFTILTGRVENTPRSRIDGLGYCSSKSLGVVDICFLLPNAWVAGL